MKKLILVPIAVLIAAGLLAACGSSSSDDSMSVTDVWTRVTAPSQDTGAVYATLKSPDDDKLVGASVPSSVAEKTEIHETVTSEADAGANPDDSMGSDSSGPRMVMHPVSSIDLPAGDDVVLEPGGYHVMLFGLKKPIAVGDSIPVTLTFENAGEVKVDATAREG